MHLDARQALILVFTFGGLVLGILILYAAVHIYRKVSNLHSLAVEGVPVADAGLIREDIKGMRTHMVSNHDEIDGELRRIAESTENIAKEAKRANHLEFERQVAAQLETIKAMAKTKEDTQ